MNKLLSTTFEHFDGSTYTIALVELDREYAVALGYDDDSQTWGQGIYSITKDDEMTKSIQRSYLNSISDFLNKHTGYQIKIA